MYWKHWLPGRETWIYYLIVIVFLMSFIDAPGGKVHWSKPLVERRLHSKMSNFSPDMSHIEYMRIEDSIRRKVQDDNFDNLSTASSWSVGPFGVSKKRKGKSWDYYFYSDGYNLHYTADYYSEDGKNYIDWREFKNGKGGIKHKDLTSVRIVREDREKSDKVLFPVSRTGYFVIMAVFLIVVVLMLYYTFRIFFGYTRRLLKNISRGMVFTSDNVYFLRALAFYLLVVGIVPPVLKLIVNLVLNSSLPPQLKFLWYSTLMENSNSVIGGLVVLLLVKAFRQGEALLEEHDLTV
jgi:hypothetical protein